MVNPWQTHGGPMVDPWWINGPKAYQVSSVCEFVSDHLGPRAAYTANCYSWDTKRPIQNNMEPFKH